MRIFKPLKGCLVYARAANATLKAGSLVGRVICVDGNICVYALGAETDRFIWKFKDGPNAWFEYAA